MARVLLGWELGGNRGHADALKQIADTLIATGHHVTIAAKEPARFDGFRSCDVMQAPVWPGLLGLGPAPRNSPAANMGDILVGLGLLMPGAFASLIRSWDALIDHVRPDVVVADYGPALSCSTGGRIRTISYGTGFCQPPADLEVFPDLVKLSQSVTMIPLIDAINDELASVGRKQVNAPPEIFATDDAVVACFAEFDPYRCSRTRGYVLPHMAELSPLIEASEGEVFVYYHRAGGPTDRLWNALEQAKLRTRVFVALADCGTLQALKRRGFIVEQHPLSWQTIAARSQMVVSHGGLGFTSGALAMGLPHLIVPSDLEKVIAGLTVRRLGIGDCVMPHDERGSIADRLSTMHGNTQVRDKTYSAAGLIRARIGRHAGRDGTSIISRLVEGRTWGCSEMGETVHA